MIMCCRIFKEKLDDSPGIVVIGHGMKNTDANEGVAAWLLENRWNVVFMNVGVGEARLGWLNYPCCLGGTVLSPDLYRQLLGQIDESEKFILVNGNQDGLSFRTLSGPPKSRGRTNVAFGHLDRPFDICDITTAEQRKRHDLFIQACALGGLKGYLFISALHLVDGFRERVLAACRQAGFEMNVTRYPGSSTECYESTDGRLFVDGRLWDENWGSVSSILDSSKVWVHLSNSEGLPESLREACMREVPCIVASDLSSQIMLPGNREALFEGEFPVGEICEPEPARVVEAVRKILDTPHAYRPRLGLMASGFDPFELNRTITVKCQEIYERRGWPWKGVSLGITAGSGCSDIDLARPIPAEIAHRGFGSLLWDPAAEYEDDYRAAYGDQS